MGFRACLSFMEPHVCNISESYIFHKNLKQFWVVMEIRTALLKKERAQKVTKINTDKTTGGYSRGTLPSVILQIFFPPLAASAI